MLEDGIFKAARGLTTIEEVLKLFRNNFNLMPLYKYKYIKDGEEKEETKEFADKGLFIMPCVWIMVL